MSREERRKGTINPLMLDSYFDARDLGVSGGGKWAVVASWPQKLDVGRYSATYGHLGVRSKGVLPGC